ncbi:MAG: methionine--tRNA ligase [Elusimicrobia bacterium]|nr:methionine--tRNA ligase [Elusimicrobiota bacterium]
MTTKKKYYITTPLYYVNAAPHLGHAYTTIAADVLARFHRMRGEPTHLLTGTDEHGQKIEEAAKAAGKTPQEFCDEISARFRALWSRLDVRFDDYIRTTETRHEDRVRELFLRLKERGDVYKGTYRGWYCVSDETYFTEVEAAPDEKGRRLCPNPECRKPLSQVSEESWFFKLSKYQRPLLDHYRAHPGFLRPSHRAPEVLRFVEAGLQDLSISRQKVKWGVPVPGDESHTIYVWFDALINYWSAAAGTDDLWPADVHIVGKEIFRFHAVIWPAMLMAAGLPLPGQVFAHGWWTVDGDKMSKSKGNFVDPDAVVAEFGVDAFRYFLLREMPFGNDGDYSKGALLRRFNSELVNDLSNLVYRVETMVDKYTGGRLPGKPPETGEDYAKSVAARAGEVADKTAALDFHGALETIWEVLRGLNAHVDHTKPFKLAKTDPAACEAVLGELVRSLRIVAGWLDPFMPQTAAKIQMQLGVRRVPDALTADDVLAGVDEHPQVIQKAPPLFMRKA